MEAERRCSDPFRGRRTNIAVATAWQCLDPVLATGFFPKDALQRRDLYAQIAFLDRRSGQAASISVSFETGTPARSTSARRRAAARCPSTTGLSPRNKISAFASRWSGPRL